MRMFYLKRYDVKELHFKDIPTLEPLSLYLPSCLPLLYKTFLPLAVVLYRFISTGNGWLEGIVENSALVYEFDSDPKLGIMDSTQVS